MVIVERERIKTNCPYSFFFFFFLISLSLISRLYHEFQTLFEIDILKIEIEIDNKNKKRV